jgi:hypothetical protein
MDREQSPASITVECVQSCSNSQGSMKSSIHNTLISR